MRLYSTTEVVAILKCDRSTVHRAATKITPAPERVDGTRAFAFNGRELRLLRRLIKPGQPGGAARVCKKRR